MQPLIALSLQVLAAPSCQICFGPYGGAVVPHMLVNIITRTSHYEILP
jgi:hypothetical protein